MRRLFLLVFTILLAALLTPPAVRAAEDENVYPVAVRWWGDGMVTVESFSKPCIAIDPVTPVEQELTQSMPSSVGLYSSWGEHSAVSNLFKGITSSQPKHPHNTDGFNIAAEFSALPNTVGSSGMTITNFDGDGPPDRASADAVVVRAYPVGHGESFANLFVVEVDGVRIFHATGASRFALTDEQLERIQPIDVMCVPLAKGIEEAARMVDRINPRLVVPIFWIPGVDGDATVDPFLKALPDKYEIVHPAGNTLAVSVAGGPTREHPQVVVLDYIPWKMPADLAELFDAKEVASKKSQDTFEKLRVDQLNHKPANGTHTPRWNAEHMGSAELYFFSSVYSKIDPAITPLRLFPQQMPPDYVAAHPEWNGMDEAMQMQRIEDFARRFAYLLDGMPLDKLPEGAPGFVTDLRGLFKQMENHYGEHTAHVHEKQEQDDWPD